MNEREAIRQAIASFPGMENELREILEAKLHPAKPLPPDEEMVVLCGYWPSTINGSKLVLCGQCGTRCCIAPSTQEQLKEHTAKVRLMCLKCYETNPPEDGPDLKKLFHGRTPPFNPFTRS